MLRVGEGHLTAGSSGHRVPYSLSDNGFQGISLHPDSSKKLGWLSMPHMSVRETRNRKSREVLIV